MSVCRVSSPRFLSVQMDLKEIFLYNGEHAAVSDAIVYVKQEDKMSVISSVLFFFSDFLTAALGPNDFVADVIFMLDSSSLVSPEEYINEKKFVKLIARYLNITPGKSRGSVIIFSSTATPVLPFDGYTTMSDFNAIIDRASQLSGTRRIDLAFRSAAILFQNARPTVRKVL